jgi:feruloyl-CoA hydratase/lyase
MDLTRLECVSVEKSDGISWVYLNRPKKKNAMSPQLHREMDAVLEELESDADTKVVVIAGSGGNFSAGQDLKECFRANEDKPGEFKRISKIANRCAGSASICTTSRQSVWLKAFVPAAPLCS